MVLESQFQGRFVTHLQEAFVGCVVLKNDPQYITGFPDLTMLYNDRWAVFEVKRGPYEPCQPNQEWYIQKLDGMGGFAAIVFPENEVEILVRLGYYFGVIR